MLEFLEVNNIALIANETIEFDKGMNVITGETGAGKSLLINSIGILLGNRINKNLIRKDKDFCKIVAKFSVEEQNKLDIQKFCDKYGFEIEDEVVISRLSNLNGKNDVRINGQLSTLSILKELTDILIDAYFQNDNQKIFDKSCHLEILDSYNQTEKLPEYINYKTNYDKLHELQNEINKLGGNNQERLTKIDILTYQKKEIENANLSSEEYEDLKNKKQLIQNLGKIISNTTLAYDCLNNQTIENVSKSKSMIGQASNYDSDLNEYFERLSSVQIELDDIRDGLEQYNQNCDYNEAEQQQIEERLDFYKKMLRKYDALEVADIFAKYDEICAELNKLENSAEYLLELKKQQDDVTKNLIKYGKLLHEKRENVAKILTKNITDNLHKLGMNNAVLELKFEDIESEQNKFYKDGLDKVEFMFSANLGEKPKPLMQIASGGEISRFMLALKTEIAKSDKTQTIIFDEIDTGISGVAVEQVAKQMARISNSHQVIVVTHSGQICAMADSNYFIYKVEENNETNTYVKKLNQTEKINEVARFMSGENITEKSLASAKELVKIQNDFKISIDK